MRIGILGAGMIGETVGTLWHKAGHQVCFGTRHPEQLHELVARPGTPVYNTGLDAAALRQALGV